MNDHGKLNVVLSAIDNANTYEEIWDNLFYYAQGLGIDAQAYYHLPSPGAVDFSEKYFVTLGFCPEESSKHRNDFTIHKNSFMNLLRPLNAPTFWARLFTTLALRSSEQALLREFYCADGNKNGLVIPCFGPAGRNGYVVFRFSKTGMRFSNNSVRAVQWAAHNAHLAFCKLRLKHASQPIRLTEREQEVLTWVARGKSNSVIADIIGISPHTVNGYLRRIYLKTDTSDRTAAAIRAVGESLIDL